MPHTQPFSMHMYISITFQPTCILAQLSRHATCFWYRCNENWMLDQVAPALSPNSILEPVLYVCTVSWYCDFQGFLLSLLTGVLLEGLRAPQLGETRGVVFDFHCFRPDSAFTSSFALVCLAPLVLYFTISPDPFHFINPLAHS